MTASLDESLQIVLPQLSPALVGPDAVKKIGSIARNLAPIHCAGFECRMGDLSASADFQQRILPGEGEAKRLKQHVLATRLADSPIWRRIADFCGLWNDPESRLGRRITGAWLEFDLQGPSNDLPAPSIFLAIEKRLAGERAIAAVKDALDQLVASPERAPLSGLERCVAACPDGTRLTDVGVMLSRKPDVLRVVVGPMRVSTVATYLAGIGWPGSPEDLEPAFACLPDRTEPVVLSLDVGPVVYPRVGIEFFPGIQPGDSPIWETLLDRMVDQGLCRPEKRQALLGWPGRTDPTETDAPWPAALIYGSLLKRGDRFSVIGRRLNHVKWVIEGTKAVEAKVYFGYGYLWLSPGKNLSETKAGPEEKLSPLHRTGQEAYIKKVQAYYDKFNEAYLKYLGPTIQAALVDTGENRPGAKASNLHLARRAGIKSGLRVLDAGCGVAGPAVDIAGETNGLSIDGITISASQALTARKRIRDAGLEDRIQIQVADYHALPYNGAIFDLAIFFESSGYSQDPHLLFREIFRVLRPGGSLYIKDLYRRPEPLTEFERKEMAMHDRLFVHRTPELSDTLCAIRAAGFVEVKSAEMTGSIRHDSFDRVIDHLVPGDTEIRARTAPRKIFFKDLPAYFAEIRAMKPEKPAI